MTFTHVNCLPPSPISCSGVKVLIIHFLPPGSSVARLKSMLMETNHFSTVDDLNVHSERPTLAQLRNYDSLLVFGFKEEGKEICRWKEPDALGDMLADFVIGGNGKNPRNLGGVVMGPLTHSLALGGKWRRHKMSPLLPGRQMTAKHMKMGKVSSFTSRDFSFSSD